MRRRRKATRHRIPAVARLGGAGVLLAWARDRDGSKVCATRLLPPERRSRAPFSCLGCGEELVPHLGAVRARHFAHRPGSSCPLTAPETALHLDAKERLLALCADAFSGTRPVTLLARCPRCRRTVPTDLGALGDHAAGEGAVGPLRADVLVLSRRRPALAFEVRVTHAVEAEKEAALATAGVPFVEIDAREEWEREGERAVEIVCERSAGFDACAVCATLERADADRARGGEAAELAELEAYRARGLFGHEAALRSGGRRATGPETPLTAPERADLVLRFRCPDCGSPALEAGDRIVRHACAGGPVRPVAWRSYDGAIVRLSWWRRGR